MQYYIMVSNRKISFIQRMGSKTNDIKEFIDILPMNVTNIIEPFGGSFAVSRDVYPDKKYNKYINDLDPMIVYLYDHPEELKAGYEE